MFGIIDILNLIEASNYGLHYHVAKDPTTWAQPHAYMGPIQLAKGPTPIWAQPMVGLGWAHAWVGPNPNYPTPCS